MTLEKWTGPVPKKKKWAGFKEPEIAVERPVIVWIKKGYAVGHHSKWGFSVLQVNPYDCLARQFQSKRSAVDYISTLDPRPEGLNLSPKSIRTWSYE